MILIAVSGKREYPLNMASGISRKKNGETADRPFGGRATIYQPEKGFRYSVDAFFLVDFVARILDRSEAGSASIAELGSGTGIVSMGLALSPSVGSVVGVEIAPELVEMARRGARSSGLSEKISFVKGDLKDARLAGLTDGSFDLVVSNPPYMKVGKGRVSRDFTRAVARHEIAATLADVVECAVRLLKPDGAFCLIYPPERFMELLDRLRERNLNPRRVRFVHPHANDPAKMVLVEACKSGIADKITFESPLIIHDERGRYTKDAEATFEGPK